MSWKPTNRDSLFTGAAEGPGTGLAPVPGLRPPAGAPPSHEPLLLRPVEAARLLGIGRSKLFEMLARQELPVNPFRSLRPHSTLRVGQLGQSGAPRERCAGHASVTQKAAL